MIDKNWIQNHLWEILFAWERGAGNIISCAPQYGAPLVDHIAAEINYCLSDPRDGEWETEIAKLVDKQDEKGILNIIKWIATDARDAASALGRVKTKKKSDASRENGKKGGRPVTRK